MSFLFQINAAREALAVNVQWYPGHMTKTRRQMQEDLKLIDVVVEVIDARAPASSRNPDFDALFAGRPRIVVMNKADLADPNVTRAWKAWYAARKQEVIEANSLKGTGTAQIPSAARAAVADKLEYDAARGRQRPVRLMVVGIPNAGKSSVINRLCGRASAKTGDRPGVTRGKQWVRLKNGLELLDTPGILWPKFDDERTALHLAYIGSIKDEIMDVETLCCHLLEFLRDRYQNELAARYKLEEVALSGMEGYEILEAVAKKRGFVVSGGELDTLRAANVVLDEFRAAKIGRMTLEEPE